MRTLLLDAEETAKQEEKKEKAQKRQHPFFRGLENGQEVAPPFFAQKWVFENPQKPYFYSASRKKLGGRHFF